MKTRKELRIILNRYSNAKRKYQIVMLKKKIYSNNESPRRRAAGYLFVCLKQS